jgi:hypothetical protein
MPGRYTVRLTVNGRAETQTLNVRMDPRITTSTLGLKQQFDLSLEAYNGIIEASSLMSEINKLNADLRAAHEKATGKPDALKAIEDVQQQIRLLTTGSRNATTGPQQPTPIAEYPLGRLTGAYTSMLDLLQDADVAPTTQAVRDMTALRSAMARARSTWSIIKTQDVPKVETQLRAFGIALRG